MVRRIVFVLFALLAGTVAAAAGWRDDLKTLRVGFLAGDNPAYDVNRLEPFRAQLQASLQLPVDLFPARSYGALIEALSSGRIQYAILSALAYVALDQDCHCGEPLVQPVAEGSVRGFRALLVVKSGSAIHTIADAKGAKLAVGPADSISGRILPFSAFATSGIQPEVFFSRIVETPQSLAALDALKNGDADIAVAWSMSDDPLAAAAGSGPLSELAGDPDMKPSDLRVVWQSDLVPFGPHVVRNSLPDEAKAAIRAALVEMRETAPEAYDSVERQLSGGFVPADATLYQRFGALLAPVSAPR